MKPYQELLNDPMWHRKRKRILVRDQYACKKCGVKNEPLEVHHRYYINNRDPWDYPDKALVALCEECHKEEHKYQETFKQLIIEMKSTFYNTDAITIFELISYIQTELHSSIDEVYYTLCQLIYDPDKLLELIKWYTKKEGE